MGSAPASKVVPAVLLAFPLAWACDEFVQHVRAGRRFCSHDVLAFE